MWPDPARSGSLSQSAPASSTLSCQLTTTVMVCGARVSRGRVQGPSGIACKGRADAATGRASPPRKNCVLSFAVSALTRNCDGVRLAAYGGAENAMTDRDARRDALSVWFMECSVLWAVFPLLDQLVENRPLDPRLISWSIVISLTTLTVGVILKRGERT